MLFQETNDLRFKHFLFAMFQPEAGSSHLMFWPYFRFCIINHILTFITLLHSELEEFTKHTIWRTPEPLHFVRSEILLLYS